MIEWFMPFQQNLDKQSLKFFARLQLGLSATYPTLVFDPNQIIRSDDAYADSPCKRRLDINRSEAKKTGRIRVTNESNVMNDGCARLSRAAASGIAAALNLGYIPSVFQGRIGGAKGVWMVDTFGETLDLKTTDGAVLDRDHRFPVEV